MAPSSIKPTGSMKNRSLYKLCQPIVREYKSTLKPLAIEALPDLLLYRPVAYLFVKAVQPLPLTPNQISTAALFTGLGGAYLLTSDLAWGYRAAGFFYFVTILLDCSDGMLARLKQNGTPLGRIVDGTIDYLYGLALFIALGITLSRGHYALPGSPWGLALLALVSMMLQSMAIDYQRSQYMLHVLGKRNSVKEDITIYQTEQQRLREKGGHHLSRLLLRLYLFYCHVQLLYEPPERMRYQAETYHRYNRYTLRLWLNIDQSTHYTMLLLSLWFFDLRFFLWYNLIFANILLVLMLPVQYFVNQKIARLSHVH